MFSGLLKLALILFFFSPHESYAKTCSQPFYDAPRARLAVEVIQQIAKPPITVLASPIFLMEMQRFLITSIGTVMKDFSNIRLRDEMRAQLFDREQQWQKLHDQSDDILFRTEIVRLIEKSKNLRDKL